MKFKTLVRGWRYETGMRRYYIGGELSEEFDETLTGWHCMVYPGEPDNFNEWMKKNMTGEYDCTYRFNSGDPAYFVTIKSEKDAAFFKLSWECES